MLMKKLLLCCLMIGLSAGLMAQGQLVSKKNAKRAAENQEMVNENYHPIEKPDVNTNGNFSEDVSRIYVGKAGHERGVRREEAITVYYDSELGVISVTNVLDPETYDEVDELGIIGAWYSTDFGQTWNGPVILNNDLSLGANYYMAGALFNPPGNTDVENMFGVHQGTIYPADAGDWKYRVFGSSTLGGDYQTNYMFEHVEYQGYWNIFGTGQYGDKMYALNIVPDGPWSGFTHIELDHQVGTLDGNVFDWDIDNLLDANLLQGSDDVVQWIGMYVGMDAGCEIAWSNDGQVGYVWMVGVSDDDLSGYQPVVFKTEDAGDNWEYIYLDFMDNDYQDILEDYLIPATGGDFIPHVFESDGVVDANGDLQIIAAMGSTSADVFNHPDSIGYHWVYPGDIFNIVVDADGLKELVWVDSLRTENVEQDGEGAYCGTEGWQHRLNAAKSENEVQVFFTWIDTRDSDQFTYNEEPDMFGWSRSVGDNPQMMPGSVCLTEDSEVEAVMWFPCGASKAFYNPETGKYAVPTIQGCTPPEFYGNSSTSEDPITLSYITGIEFDVLTGIDEHPTMVQPFTVSANVPNPFRGTTSIEVNTQGSMPVSVEVSNMMGQSIYIIDAGIINGTQNIELTSENMEAGIYFYTVKSGSESITQKMIVK